MMNPKIIAKAVGAMASGDMMKLMELIPIERSRKEEWLVMGVPILPILMNPLGIVHGGVTAFILDSAMGWSVADATGKQVVTVQMNVHYLAPGKGKKLRVYARPTHLGKQTAVAEAYIENDEGKRIAQATGTFFYTGEPAIPFEETK